MSDETITEEKEAVETVEDQANEALDGATETATEEASSEGDSAVVDEAGIDTVIVVGNDDDEDEDDDDMPRGKHAATPGKTVVLPSVGTGSESDIVETITVGSVEPEPEAFETITVGKTDEETVAIPTPVEAPLEAAGPAIEPTEVQPPIAEAAAPAQTDQAGFVATFKPIPAKRGRKALKIAGITFGVLIGALAVAYFAGVYAFSNWFLPGTSIGGMDISLKSNEEVKVLLDNTVSSYKLDIMGGNFIYRVNAADVDMSIDSDKAVEDMHENLSPWRWPLLLLEGSHDESQAFVIDYDRAELASQISTRIDSYNDTAEAPQNAYVSYDEKADSFVVVPETAGTQFDPALVFDASDAAVQSLTPKVQLASDQLVKAEVLQTDTRLVNAAQQANSMVKADIKLTMPGGADAGSINSDNLSPLVTITEDYEVTLDEESLNAWIDSYVDGYNTIGSERSYTRPDGKDIVISGGAYGWEIDNEALYNEILEAVKSGSTTEIEVPCWSTAQVYNGKGERDWGNRYIDIDLSEQHVYFYDENNELIWESDCISGQPDGKHDTVPGVWYITNKESPSKLIGYEGNKKEYETTVAFWMAFEGNAIGLHDATWQPGFGGTMYANGYGSHGCVNLPYDAAQELYSLCDVNDVVVAHW